MKRSTPLKEAVVTTATPLASMPPEPVIVESEKAKTAEGTQKETSLTPVVVLEPEEATEEETMETPAVVEMPEKATSSRAQEAAKSPTSEAIELVVSDVREAYPLPSAEFSGLLRMLEETHKVSMLFCTSE